MSLSPMHRKLHELHDYYGLVHHSIPSTWHIAQHIVGNTDMTRLVIAENFLGIKPQQISYCIKI